MVTMGIVVIICGLGLWFIPSCSSIFQIGALILGLGLAVGVVDTAGNVAALMLWKDNPKTQNSVLQALHAGFALGGMLCSPLARPFLGEYKIGDQDVNQILQDKQSTDDQNWEVITENNLSKVSEIVLIHCHF